MGASFSNSSTSNVPRLVSKTNMGGKASWPFAFGNALVAGEIAVRGYVSEATVHKQSAQGRGLGRAMFQREPAARYEVSRRAVDEGVERPKAIAAGCQGRAWLESHAVAFERGIVGSDI